MRRRESRRVSQLLATTVGLLAGLSVASTAAAVVIDFETLQPGTIVTDAVLPAGFTIDVDNRDERHPDAAIIYDTSCTGGCSGGDDDLRTPGFGIDNDAAQGNMMVIAENVDDRDPGDGLVDAPDDELAGGTITFGLPEPGVLRSMRIVDVDVNEPQGFLELFATDGSTPTFPLEALGNNSAQTIEIADPPSIDGFRIFLFSSGAFDDIVVDLDGDESPGDNESGGEDDGEDDDGDECPVPNPEICNNGTDDDGDGAIDCGDGDCPFGVPTCGEDGEIVPPCERIRRDPARIRFDVRTTAADYLKVHGRFFLHSEMALELDGFSVLLTNEHGTIFHGTLARGELRRRVGGKGQYAFVDRDARRGGPGDADNLYKVSAKLRRIGGLPVAVFRVKAYGDFSLATEPVMTLQVRIGDDVASLTAPWRRRARGWRLDNADFH